ncbi:MAG: molybdopterin-dependent oxidoreductase [Planctomycetota bacterium]|nr:molybdopterin-dependent oxidoreductase [Planctomycetota bacterium]
MSHETFMGEHLQVTRRHFQRLGLASAMAGSMPLASRGRSAGGQQRGASRPVPAGVRPEPYFTPAGEFQDVSRGKPLPHALPDEKKREVGLTRESWRLEVLSDPDHPARLKQELTGAKATALDFQGLLKIGETHLVRFAKVMTCLNMGCPLGMGLWEGVPMREVVALTQPRENLRRVFYYGFHNNDPTQMFRSSLPIGRVLEDPYDLPPVILCYKLNGEWLDSKRGGPVRVVVPEGYGFKSIKWLSHLVLTNLSHANDTYAEQNNDVDSPLKTFAASLSVPLEVKSGQPVPVSGYAQVGISGLSKVQICIEPADKPVAENDPYFLKSKWTDATLLPPPELWNSLKAGKIPPPTHGFDDSGKPKTWPMRLTNSHWAALIPGLGQGEYNFRCRTIDEKGQPQPLPRPLRKSGHNAIESLVIRVKG